MSNLSPMCRAHAMYSSSVVYCYRSMVKISSLECSNSSRPMSMSSNFAVSFDRLGEQGKFKTRQRLNRQRRMVTMGASNWTNSKSPYDTLELERGATEEQIKVAYRRLAKFYHPDVYDGRGTLDEGETAEARFMKIQAAYELLIDKEERRKYDFDNRVNPMKASQAWMKWLMKKQKAFEQRGGMAGAAWTEQQQLERNLRARRLARSKIDPEEERKILVKEKKASEEYYHVTLRRHTLVLKKRDLMRKKAEEDKRKILGRLLAAEGLELEKDEDE